MNDFSKSVARTLTPIVVGYVGALLMHLGVHTNNTELANAIAPLIAAAYYLVVRVVEHYVPAAGWLLGHASAPGYASTLANTVPTALNEKSSDSLADFAEKAVEEVKKDVKSELNKVAAPVKKATAKKTTAAKKPAPKKSSN